jgi:site-specific DNA-methyltransferase (cytosine-N4-specific)
MVSTGDIGSEARRFANKTMSDSNLCVVMVDRKDIVQIVKNPTTIVDVFNREAQHAMKIKVLDLGH